MPLLLDYRALAIVFAGLCVCLLHVSQSAPSDFAIDLVMHADYITHVATYHRLPVQGELPAYYHLPTYYVITAGIYNLAHALSLDGIQLARYVALICYSIYLLLAALLLKKLLGAAMQHQAITYLTLAVLAFWPVGIVVSGRLHPEVLAYVGHMGLLYCLISWMIDRRNSQLANAFVFCGIFLLARNFATFFLGLLSLFTCYAFYLNRQRLSSFISVRMLLSIGFCVLCYYISASHHDLAPNTSPTRPRTPFSWDTDYLAELLITFGYFNPLLFMTETALDPHIGRSLDYHLHYFLRSALLGEFTGYKAWPMVFAANTVWFFIMLYTLWGFIAVAWRRFNADQKKAYGLIIFLIVMMCGMVAGARFYHPHMPNISDARYIFPVTALFIACFGQTIISYQQAGRTTMASIGRGLAIGIIGLSVAIFIGQYIPINI